MKWILNIEDSKWNLATEHWESRPLSAPPEKRDHPHGGWDVASVEKDSNVQNVLGINGLGFYAPEDGKLVYYVAMRDSLSRSVAEFGIGSPNSRANPNDNSFFDFKKNNYFYDTYGALVMLKGSSGVTHIMAHSYVNQLFNIMKDYWINKKFVKVNFEIYESVKNERFPLFSINNFSNPISVKEGELIGLMGNAGYSTGKHIHYECHRNGSWEPHKTRVDLSTVYPDVWKKNKSDLKYDWEAEKRKWASK